MKKGNGLGENNAKSWNPKAVGDYKRGMQMTNQRKVEDEKRKGAGAKQ